jgi:hypothetical protein
MKKLYSLVAIAMFSVAAVAQTTLLSEDFAAYTAGGSTATSGAGVSPDTSDIYAAGTFPTGVPSANFPTGTKVYQSGGSVKLGSGTLVGSMTSKVLDLSANSGQFTVSFDVKGWTTVEGSITVTVTGLTAQTVTYTSTVSGAFQSKSVSFTGGTAGSTVTIATTAKRAFIDNVKITTGTLAVGDVKSTKVSLVKNTSVKESLQFGSKADIQIVNMAGQVVKNASVNENTILNVSSLAKGVYFVTATVDGKKVSQKIIKN